MVGVVVKLLGCMWEFNGASASPRLAGRVPGEEPQRGGAMWLVLHAFGSYEVRCVPFVEAGEREKEIF